MRAPAAPRVALVHDYLNQRGGAERVFAHIARAYPDAPVYTALFDAKATGDLVDASRVRTSALQRVPFARRGFRLLAPFYPAAFEHFDLSSYDLIVSSTTAWAKGVRFRPDAVHVCYINTVSRFAFAYDDYVGGFGAARFARPLVARLTEWDRRAAQRPTAYIANSQNVADRVRRYYGRGARVLHCPVDVDRFRVGGGLGGYFLVVSRLLPYKRVEIAVAACAKANVELKIVGVGPAEAALKRAAAGTRTEFLGALGDDALQTVMGRARAVIVTAEEDYGLVALEANASGRPVFAYGSGGALETVIPGVTGELFFEQAPEALASLVAGYGSRRYDPAILRAHALTFSPERFVARLRAFVAEAVLAGPAVRDFAQEGEQE